MSDVAEELTTATEDQAAASVSRTGQLVYSALSHTLALWALSLDAAHGRAPAAPERLTNGLEYNRYPTISSDGSTLCFARVGSNGQAVWVRSLRTGLERQLVPADGAVGLPVMSPDGSRIAFPHQVRDVTAIEVIRPDGGAPERVLPRRAACAASRDGRTTTGSCS